MTNKKAITFRNDERTAIIHYLTIKAKRAELEKEEKTAKAALKGVFEMLGRTLKMESDKTDYIGGTIQVHGHARGVVYKETTAKGAIDWEGYARTLGGTDEGAERHRKPSNVRTSIDWATKAQEEEILGGA